MIFPFSFFTPIANGCSHVLNMYDSWGDGWNDSYVTITSESGELLLTGTPVENSISDLWSLMDISNNKYFGA